MGRSALPSTLHIGPIRVETHDLFLAREVAAIIEAMPAADATEGVITLNGKHIRWWRSTPNPITIDYAKRINIAR